HSTEIEYTLPQIGHVTMAVYNAVGEEVATLVNDEQSAGKHAIIFSGDKMKNGFYFYRLTSGNYSQTGMMVVAR
ncbi:MAG TPA: T9SS type A sorting domain-containing protein, partial [Candidatus Kapabacteria bacterium]|nr:T9SS type A sorting domain-containing protein [Candidatus Kapabacteria bacterium]